MATKFQIDGIEIDFDTFEGMMAVRNIATEDAYQGRDRADQFPEGDARDAYRAYNG